MQIFVLNFCSRLVCFGILCNATSTMRFYAKTVKQNPFFTFVLIAMTVVLLQLTTQLTMKNPPTQTSDTFSAGTKDEEGTVTMLEDIMESKVRERYALFANNTTPLYIITPTYPRAEQLAELTRIGQTLMNVKDILWIVSEDSPVSTQSVLDYLHDSGLSYVYLRVMMPEKFNKSKVKPRGVANRNAGLEWIKQNAKTGVLYFADDDNTYDIRIFEEIRTTKRVSMFPVGLVTKIGISTPIVKNGKIIGFYDGWVGGRKFPVDMACFAVNVKFLLSKPKASMPFKPGYEEDGFLKSLGISVGDIEPKAKNCTKIWVWHTQTKKNKGAIKKIKDNEIIDTNLEIILKQLWTGS